MTVAFPHPLFPITSPRTFRGKRGLVSRLLAPDCQAYCLLIFIDVQGRLRIERTAVTFPLDKHSVS